ncbi:MAG TPA: sugar nucleotide-binding protein [Candidatus Paceibacterota bacterium]
MEGESEMIYAHNPMQKKSVAILGATGMLGNALYAGLKDAYELILVVRNTKKVPLLERKYGYTAEHQIIEFDAAKSYEDFLSNKGYPDGHLLRLFDSLKDADYVINAIGVTIPFSSENPALTFFINGVLPHLLAAHFGEHLIHITTDCVYDGKTGFPYDENSPKSPPDLYGLSKSLGEPTNCLTLRTSIVGRELEGFTGLLEWFLTQKGKAVKGFANHLWNGITTKEFAKICGKIMSDPSKYHKIGLYHVFSTTVSKYEMLLVFQKKFGIDCKIVPEYENKLNRTLSTVYKFNNLFKILSFEEMIQEL